MKPKFKIDEIMLVFVVALIAMAASIYNEISKKRGIQAEDITSIILDDHIISFASNGVIDENKLRQIQMMSYEEFKSYLNAKNDFCIHIEDSKGSIILAKGSSKLGKDGMPCKG